MVPWVLLGVHECPLELGGAGSFQEAVGVGGPLGVVCPWVIPGAGGSCGLLGARGATSPAGLQVTGCSWVLGVPQGLCDTGAPSVPPSCPCRARGWPCVCSPPTHSPSGWGSALQQHPGYIPKGPTTALTSHDPRGMSAYFVILSHPRGAPQPSHRGETPLPTPMSRRAFWYI